MQRGDVLLLYALIAFSGCHMLHHASTPARRAATEQAARGEHGTLADLEFFDDPSVADPLPDQPYGAVAAYSIAQMSGLQPALANSPAVPFTALPAPGRMSYEGYNVMAYAAGGHPVKASELVIVGADLDGPAPHTGLAALMEIARSYSSDARRGLIPERTVMIAAFSGSGSGFAGLRAYLRRPLWPIAQTTALVYLSPADTTALNGVLASQDTALQLEVLHTNSGHTPDAAQISLEDASTEATRIAQEAERLLQNLTTLE